MLEKDMSTGCQLLTHEPMAESDMFLRLHKLNFELLVPLGAIDRFVQVLDVAELCTKGGNILLNTVPSTGLVLVLVVVCSGC